MIVGATNKSNRRLSAATDEIAISGESWRVNLWSDEAANDSDKSFPCPAASEVQVLWIWVELTTTATVGDRQLVIEIQDAAADVIGHVSRVGLVQAASLTRYFLFAPAMPDMNAFRDTDWLSVTIPPSVFLSAGQILRIYDNNAIDAAADDMIVQMQYALRAV